MSELPQRTALDVPSQLGYSGPFSTGTFVKPTHGVCVHEVRTLIFPELQRELEKDEGLERSFELPSQTP